MRLPPPDLNRTHPVAGRPLQVRRPPATHHPTVLTFSRGASPTPRKPPRVATRHTAGRHIPSFRLGTPNLAAPEPHNPRRPARPRARARDFDTAFRTDRTLIGTVG